MNCGEIETGVKHSANDNSNAARKIDVTAEKEITLKCKYCLPEVFFSSEEDIQMPTKN